MGQLTDGQLEVVADFMNDYLRRRDRKLFVASLLGTSIPLAIVGIISLIVYLVR